MPPVVIPKRICQQEQCPAILRKTVGASAGLVSTEEVFSHSILVVCGDFLVKQTIRWLKYLIPTSDFLDVKVNRLALSESQNEYPSGQKSKDNRSNSV